ncbi:MAG: tetratricopeptide repeat protein, partial [Gammaproteobacteria bacterium]
MTDQSTTLVYIKNQAGVLLRDNQLEQAATLLDNACLVNCKDREIWEMQAYVYSQLENTEKLVKACFKLVELLPTAANHHFNLAFALQGAGQLPESAKAYRKTLELDPQDAQAEYNLALILQQMEETDAAEAHYKKALSIKPDWPEAINNFTQILNEKGDFSLAESLLKNAIKKTPSAINLYYRLGETYDHNCKYEESIATYNKALRLDRKSTGLCVRIADVLLRANKATDALKYYQSAQQLDPANIDAALGLISVYESQGDYDTARQHLSLLLENEEPNIQIALKYAHLFKDQDQSNKASELINKLLQDNKLSNQFKIKAHFALGKLYDSAKNYDAAFLNFQQANNLKQHSFNAPRISKLVDAIIAEFSIAQLKNSPKTSNAVNPSKPVFIIGMPRSGTSLVEQILAGHSQVFAAGELDILPRTILNISALIGCDNPYPYIVGSLTEGMLNKLANHYLEQLAKLTESKPCIITDK